MKKTLLTLAMLATTAAAPFILSGCAKEGYEQAADTKQECVELKAKLTALSAQITATSASLNALVSDTTSDPTQRYKTFEEAAEKVVSLDKDVRETGASVQEKAKSVTDKWNANLAAITDEKIRKESEEQKEEYSKKFKKVREVNEKASQATTAYITKLKDVRTYLSANLSPEGIKGAQDFAKDTTGRGKDAIESINSVIEIVTKVADATAPVTTPDAPAPAK